MCVCVIKPILLFTSLSPSLWFYNINRANHGPIEFWKLFFPFHRVRTEELKLIVTFLPRLFVYQPSPSVRSSLWCSSALLNQDICQVIDLIYWSHIIRQLQQLAQVWFGFILQFNLLWIWIVERERLLYRLVGIHRPWRQQSKVQKFQRHETIQNEFIFYFMYFIFLFLHILIFI